MKILNHIKNAYNLYKRTNIKKMLLWIIWDFSGARLVYLKLFPNKSSIENSDEYRKPSSLMLWIMGIYVTLYGLIIQNYDREISRINNYIDFQLLDYETRKTEDKINTISFIQQISLCPIQPFFFSPITIYNSFFHNSQKECKNTKVITLKLFKKLKDKLNRQSIVAISIIGSKWDLINKRHIQLNASNFENSYIGMSKFINIDLRNSNFENTNINSSDFSYSNLNNANFSNSEMIEVKLNNANLENVSFLGATMFDVDFSNTNISYEQLKHVKQIVNTIGIDENIIAKLNKNYPYIISKKE